MKKFLLCLAGIFFYATQLPGQYYFYDSRHLEPMWRMEMGISLGLMNCLTDLGGHKGNGKKFLKDVNWNASKPCGSVFMETTHQDLFGFRIESSWGNISASDSVLKNDQTAGALRYARNLHFRSRIAEYGGLISFHPLYMNSRRTPAFSPYLLLGIGYFQFQPEAFIDGSWVKLHPLHTEGQGFKEFPDRREYKLGQLNMPLGLGLKYEISVFVVARIELIYRFLATDYLDDVSTAYIDPSFFYKYFPQQIAEMANRLADRSKELNPMHQTIPGAIRGNAKNNDGYFSLNLKASMVLNRKRL